MNNCQHCSHLVKITRNKSESGRVFYIGTCRISNQSRVAHFERDQACMDHVFTSMSAEARVAA